MNKSRQTHLSPRKGRWLRTPIGCGLRQGSCSASTTYCSPTLDGNNSMCLHRGSMGVRKSRAEGFHVPYCWGRFQLLSCRRVTSSRVIYFTPSCGLARKKMSCLKEPRISALIRRQYLFSTRDANSIEDVGYLENRTKHLPIRSKKATAHGNQSQPRCSICRSRRVKFLRRWR